MTDAMHAAVAAIEVDADDEEALYRLLALRMKTLERNPAMAGEFSPATIAPTELGIAVPDLVAFGRNAFLRLATAGQSMICGTEANQGFHLQRILSTLNTDVTTVTAAVATMLVGQLAIAPMIAGIVATIVVGKVAPNSLEALCKTWASKLGPSATTPTAPPATTPGDPTATPPAEPTAPPAPPATPTDPPTT